MNDKYTAKITIEEIDEQGNILSSDTKEIQGSNAGEDGYISMTPINRSDTLTLAGNELPAKTRKKLKKHFKK